jgi:apolipoprotein D and lipocalin family protein
MKLPVMKNRRLAILFCLSALSTWAGVNAAENESPGPASALRAIPALDVPRYMGTWYEIAKYPNWFQKKCSGATQAHYSLLGDGRVKVLNRCRTAGGELSEASGMARQLGSSTSAKLQVRFAPAWFSFLPFVWGDYWVIELDEHYQLVAVSEPKREYLWILSRTPRVDPAVYNALLARLRQKGFDLNKLELTQQD